MTTLTFEVNQPNAGLYYWNRLKKGNEPGGFCQLRGGRELGGGKNQKSKNIVKGENHKNNTKR